MPEDKARKRAVRARMAETGERYTAAARKLTAEPSPAEHFLGCHPEDAEGSRELPDGRQPQEAEDCWHCGTPTTRGCNCAECWEGSDYIPPTASYHCRTCGRWWAWMTGLNITEITFGASANEAGRGVTVTTRKTAPYLEDDGSPVHSDAWYDDGPGDYEDD